jgi:hypothetical protein
MDFDHSASTYTGKSTIMSVIRSIAVSKVVSRNYSVYVLWNEQGRDVQNADSQAVFVLSAQVLKEMS